MTRNLFKQHGSPTHANITQALLQQIADPNFQRARRGIPSRDAKNHGVCKEWNGTITSPGIVPSPIIVSWNATSFANERATSGRDLATLLEFLKLVDAVVLVADARALPSSNHHLKSVIVRIFRDLAVLVKLVHSKQQRFGAIRGLQSNPLEDDESDQSVGVVRRQALAGFEIPKDSDEVVGTRHVVDRAQASDRRVEELVLWDRHDAAFDVLVARGFEKVGRMSEAPRIDPASDASGNFDVIDACGGVPVNSEVFHPFHGFHHAVRSIRTGGNGPVQGRLCH